MRALTRRTPIVFGTYLTAVAALALASATAPALATDAAPTASATASKLRAHVDYLAAPERGGRLTGTEHAQEAADYIVRELQQMDVQPLPGEDDLLLEFEFTAGSSDSGSSLSIGDEAWQGTDKVQALSFSDSGTVSGGLVFAGYGLRIPEGQDFPYDSYAGIDVEGKVVLVLRYFPEDVDQETRALLGRYSGLRYKAMQAREQGAVGMLVVAGPRSPNAGEIIPMSFDTAISGSGIAAASISGELAERLMAGSKRTLEEAQKAFDDGNPHVTGFEIAGLEVELETRVERERRTGRNVVGWLPAQAGAAERDAILVGAHYDHLGDGRGGNSLARKGETGEPHLGADDNASGVAAVLEITRRLAKMERPRAVAIAFWTGEELGLLGSTAFTKDGQLPIDRIAAYVNFDMVGRLKDNRLALQAVGSSPAWRSLIERSNVPVGFDLQLQDDPYLPTDSSAFNQAEIPTLNFFTGSHEDYHRPTDSAEKLNYEGIERIVDLGALVAARLIALEEDPQFAKVERQRAEGGDRDTLRAYTGTIPDYTTEVEGLLLSGVMEGGPADAAGLLGGDVIVEFGGQTITNIYDYTYALDAVKIGEAVKVVVMRDGERLEMELTPTARD